MSPDSTPLPSPLVAWINGRLALDEQPIEVVSVAFPTDSTLVATLRVAKFGIRMTVRATAPVRHDGRMLVIDHPVIEREHGPSNAIEEKLVGWVSDWLTRRLADRHARELARIGIRIEA